MAARGEVSPMPDGAIFADTQAEPASVYRWLDWLEDQLPFPLHRVTEGSLTDAVLAQKKKGDGIAVRNLLPVFVRSKEGRSEGKVQRACTFDYKIRPLLKLQRNLASIKRGQKKVSVTTWIGISTDEVSRMKPSRERWCQHRWPLVEAGMSRHDCLLWMERNGYPTPPRSACVYCPFHSNAEWRRLKTEEPDAFEDASLFEHMLQGLHMRTDIVAGHIKGTPYLHRSCEPIHQVDLSTDLDRGQMGLFDNECEGMCGV